MRWLNVLFGNLPLPSFVLFQTPISQLISLWRLRSRARSTLPLEATDSPHLAFIPRIYPSHLYLCLLPRARNQGNGRRLVTMVTQHLREAGSPGVHATVHIRNDRSKGFLKHIGFQMFSPSSEENTSSQTHTFFKISLPLFSHRGN